MQASGKIDHAFPVAKIRRGHFIWRDPYRLKVLGVGFGKDRFGRDMLKFDMEIVAGPDRVGDKGPMLFGQTGVVKRCNRQG